MDVELDPADRRPIFLQIADAVRGAIARGDLATGSPLPPVRALAPQLGVHPNTVLQAYHELALHGTVESRRGSGTFVRASPPGDGERRVMADEVAGRALRDAHAHGLTAVDLGAALDRAARRGAP
ncbi:MAG: GntR family transcriptional regulator [Gemmatimonadaceae bacterium]